jgi:hypothetical protein
MSMSGLPENDYELRQLSLKGKEEAVDAWVLKTSEAI